MSSKDPEDDLLRHMEDFAVALVRRAGEMALDALRRPLRVEFKKENRADPVTEADRAVEQFLRSSIAREYPDHGVLGEEGTEVEARGHEYLWVLDPVDGTTNFANRLPLFSCSAGLLRRGEPVVGALFLPMAPAIEDEENGDSQVRSSSQGPHSSVLHARLGGGAFLDGRPVRASEAPEPDPSSLAGLPGHHSRQFSRGGGLRTNPGELRCLGSVCFETALVACGVFRYAVFRGPKLWDVAAGTLIVREAGGQVLVWVKGRWQPLTRFEPMENPSRRGERGLRFWTAITLVGGGRVATYVAERLRPRIGLRERARRLVRALLVVLTARGAVGRLRRGCRPWGRDWCPPG